MSTIKNVEIFVDQRERKIIPHFDIPLNGDFSNMGISIKKLTLTTADFAIIYKNHILALIERKTWKDLSATFKDQKRKFNYKKMLEERSKHPTCIFVAYLIEGPRYTNRKSKICKMPFSRLRAHLDHLIFEHNIHIIYSKNKNDTAYRILELAKNIISMHPEFNPMKKINESLRSFEKRSKTENDGTLKLGNIDLHSKSLSDFSGKKNANPISTSEKKEEDSEKKGEDSEKKEEKLEARTRFDKSLEKSGGTAEAVLTATKKIEDNTVIAMLWSSVKGVSQTMAGMFMQQDLSVRNMILGDYTVAQIQAMRYPGGRLIGEKKAREVIKKFTTFDTNKDRAVKFLSSVPSVSKKSAGKILDSITLKDIVNLTEEEKSMIADIKFTEKRKIGKAMALKIIKFLGQ